MVATPKIRSRSRARAEVIKALAHPSRLLILERLEENEQCVSDLTDFVQADVSTVSKHLAILKAVGLVTVEKRGLQQFYSLACPCLTSFFDCVDSLASNRIQRLRK